MRIFLAKLTQAMSRRRLMLLPLPPPSMLRILVPPSPPPSSFSSSSRSSFIITGSVKLTYRFFATLTQIIYPPLALTNPIIPCWSTLSNKLALSSALALINLCHCCLTTVPSKNSSVHNIQSQYKIQPVQIFQYKISSPLPYRLPLPCCVASVLHSVALPC